MTGPDTQEPRQPWADDDDGDHSAFTHRDDDEPPPYVVSREPDPVPGPEPLRDTALASLICERNDHPDAPACDGCYAMAAHLRENGYALAAARPSPDEPPDLECLECGGRIGPRRAADEPPVADLRTAQREVVRVWFDVGHETGRMEYDELLDRLAALRDPAPLAVEDREGLRDDDGKPLLWHAWSAIDWLDHGDRAAADHMLRVLSDRELIALLRPLADAYDRLLSEPPAARLSSSEDRTP